MKPDQDRIFRVAPDQANQTLAAVLRHWLPDRSWGEARQLIRSRHVTVSGNLCVDHGRRLQAAEVVKLLVHPAAAPPTERDVRLRYVDEHVVVVEKPAGMTSLRHPEERGWPPRRKQLQPTLDELLPRLVAAMRVRGGKSKRPRGIAPPVRPVHRLDRETSGLMVFARTIRAERNLGEQFRNHSIERRYLAVVLGAVSTQKIESYLTRDRGDGRRGSTPNAQQGKRAVTHVRPIETLGEYSLVECRLETGRTHQIRIHLSEAGHPVCGDKLYFCSRQGAPRVDRSGANRLALHAGVLGFVHPVSGEKLRFEMPLAPDLQVLVKQLRQSGATSPSGKRGKLPGQRRGIKRSSRRQVE